MKKSLLTLSLLGLGLGASAQVLVKQGPWAEVNLTTVTAPPRMSMSQFQTLSPTFCWILGNDNSQPATSRPNNLLLTTRVGGTGPAGTEFVYNSVSGSSSALQPTNISAVNQTLAFCGQFGTPNGGEVIRTTNGGARWRVVSTPNMFVLPEGFCNFVYMFDANEGITMGDPNPLPPPGGGAGVFEIYRTTTASATTPAWTRVTGLPAPLDRNEFGIVNSYTGLGSTVWLGTSHNDGAAPPLPLPARVMRSTDRGQTWNVYNTPFIGAVSQLAFKDQNNGIAFNPTATGADIIRTTDGGVTWTPVVADTTRGQFYRFEITAIPGQGYISVGTYRNSTLTGFDAAIWGCSFSPDGVQWITLERGARRSLSSAGLIACTSSPRVNDLNFLQGYVGGANAGATPAPNPTRGGQGGIYQVSPNTCGIITAARNPALQRSLTVYPNPSANGQFSISLSDGIRAGTELAVFDIMGRLITTRTLNATAVNANSVELDLSAQKSGVYTLRLSTAGGIATEKLVIQ